MTKKYKLTHRTITTDDGKILHMIQALRNFGDIKKGDFGGYVESEFNLAQYDNCWVYGNAKVFDHARVDNHAKIYDNVKVFDEAQVYELAQIHDNAEVFDSAEVHDHAKVYDKVLICDSAEVCGHSKIYNKTRIEGLSRICDEILGQQMQDTTIPKKQNAEHVFNNNSTKNPIDIPFKVAIPHNSTSHDFNPVFNSIHIGPEDEAAGSFLRIEFVGGDENETQLLEVDWDEWDRIVKTVEKYRKNWEW